MSLPPDKPSVLLLAAAMNVPPEEALKWISQSAWYRETAARLAAAHKRLADSRVAAALEEAVDRIEPIGREEDWDEWQHSRHDATNILRALKPKEPTE